MQITNLSTAVVIETHCTVVVSELKTRQAKDIFRLLEIDSCKIQLKPYYACA